MELTSNEIWKDIKGYEGRYQVSNMGNVKSLNYNYTGKEKNLRARKPNTYNKYMAIELCKNNKKEVFFIHRLVAEAFIQNFKNLPVVNHKDGNKTNNKADNLEWCSYSSNVRHAYDTKLIKLKNRAVSQYGLDGKYIRDWNGVREIQRTLGYSSGALCDCCKGRQKTAYGYIWKYAN